MTIPRSNKNIRTSSIVRYSTCTGPSSGPTIFWLGLPSRRLTIFLYRLQVAGALFHGLAIGIEHVVFGRRFGDQIFDEAMQVGAMLAVFAYDHLIELSDQFDGGVSSESAVMSLWITDGPSGKAYSINLCD